MLFGFDNVQQITDFHSREKSKLFTKPLWGQNKKKYESLFNETELFIIYGLSLGMTDRWWWKQIANSLLSTDSELIIYSYGTMLEKDEVRDRFIEASGIELERKTKDKLYRKIFVVIFSEIKMTRAFNY